MSGAKHDIDFFRHASISILVLHCGGYSVTSGFSILQIVHSAEGILTVALSLMFLFNKLPTPTSKWMKITAVLWIVGIALGTAVYYAMPFKTNLTGSTNFVVIRELAEKQP